MKPVLLLALSLGFSTACFGQADKSAKAIYDADTKKVESGDLNFDWKEYRLAAFQGGTPYFDWHPVRAKFNQQMGSGDTDVALKSANEIISHNMAEPEGHLLALIVYQKLGKQEEASFQHNVVKAYIDSILNSGDGKSSQTAFFVVTVDEEYFYLHIVLGIGLPESQALVVVNGHSFDKLKVKDENGKEQEIWFNVDTSINSMRDSLSGNKKK
jgi:hypothetical protein